MVLLFHIDGINNWGANYTHCFLICKSLCFYCLFINKITIIFLLYFKFIFIPLKTVAYMYVKPAGVK